LTRASRTTCEGTGLTSERLPSGPLLLLSPHFDDAALSCAALIDRAEPADIITVFAGSPDPPVQGDWDRRTGFRDSSASLSARLIEERAAFADTPHRLGTLSLLETQYRSGPRPEADVRTFVSAVSTWLTQNPEATVAAPAGAGRVPGRVRNRLHRLAPPRPHRHPDHVFVRDAALSVLASFPRATPILYEEFPYLVGASANREIEKLVGKRKLSAIPIVVTVDREVKARRIATYETQVPHLRFEGKRVDDASDLPPIERYWLIHWGSSSD
jgi:hypothetical protein